MCVQLLVPYINHGNLSVHVSGDPGRMGSLRHVCPSHLNK